MANLKYKDNHGNWVSLSTVRGPMGPEGPQGPVGPEARINLNGSQVQNPSFYAPLTGGTAGQILTSNGNGAAPTWQEATTNLEVVNNLNTSIISDTKVLGAYEGYILNQNKVDKSLTIAGLTLQNNITVDQLKSAGLAKTTDLNSYLPLSGGEMTGTIYLKKTGSHSRLMLRDNGSYKCGIGYDYAGNEALSLWAYNTVTRLRWHAGIDMTNLTDGMMMNITPDFEVSKANGNPCMYKGGANVPAVWVQTSQPTAKQVGDIWIS